VSRRRSAAPSARGRATVLFVDDDVLVLQSLRRVLRREPYAVVTSSSPVEALKLLAAGSIAVIVADQHMPEMLGSDLLAVVRRDFAAVTRILMTGDGDGATARACAPWRVILKPVLPKELAEVLREAVAAARPRSPSVPSPHRAAPSSGRDAGERASDLSGPKSGQAQAPA
jgi:DNA-binding NtrC family response regulator